ncbi:hypothetical protein FRC06_003094 [Ceratobasidium sp. 370]|nr:hypothetical protein FRC06_003094 [Ceratobasidium sp. 370]
MATPFIDSEVAPVQYYHLQSHTPPPAEKTLLWLQGVNEAGPPLHPAIDSTSEYAEETPGKTVQMLPGDIPPERHPLSPPPPVAQLASPRKPRREEPPSDWVPPSYLAPRGNEAQPPPSESRIGGLDLEYAVFGDHGAGSEASYQRTLQQAAGGYPPVDPEHDELAELEGDLYEDDADSNEQERPQSMMSPRAESRTVSRSGAQSEVTADPVAEITGEVQNLWGPPGNVLPPIKTQGTGTSARWKPPPDSAGTETSFFKPAGPLGSVHASAVPLPPSAPITAQVTGSRVVPQSTGQTGSRIVPQSTGMTSKQSTTRGPAPVAPQMTGQTGKQSTTRGPIAPQTTGRQSTARGPIASQATGTTNKQSSARGPIQTQVTGSRSGSGAKVVPQMTGRSAKTGTTRTQVVQPTPRHPGSAVGGTSVGRAKSPLGRGSVADSQPSGQYGGYQSFGGVMEGAGIDDHGSYASEGGGYVDRRYEGENYPGEDGNSFAGEGMAYAGEEIGRAPSVAESVHTLRNEPKPHPFAGSAAAPSEAGIHPLRSVPPSEVGTQPFRTASPAGSRVSHRRSVSGAANGNGHLERSTTPRSHHHSVSGGYAPENDYHYSRRGGDATPTPSEGGIIDRVPDMSERELLEVLKTPRTSYTVSPSVLAEEVQRSHYHDEDLCILLHAAEDPNQHEVIRKAVRKAAKMRIKRLGIEEDRQRKEPLPIAAPPDSSVAPEWAQPLFHMLQDAQARLDSLDGGRNRIEAPPSHMGGSQRPTSEAHYDLNVGRTPATVNVNINRVSTVPSGTQVAESVLGSKTNDYQHGPGYDDMGDHHHHHHTREHTHERDPDSVRQALRDFLHPADEREQSVAGGQSFMGHARDQQEQSVYGNDQSLFGNEHEPSIAGVNGELEEELYKLRMKNPAKSETSHKPWNNDEVPDIPGEERGEEPQSAVSAPPGAGALQAYVAPPVWQRVHQRLLNWAMVWPLSELDKALASTERGHQVEEIALSVWCTQVYKRYVRARMSEGGVNASGETGAQKVDRMYVPPNMADAISTAVYNGRHGDACQMLKDMWTPFGLDGMPRLIIVLARHRRDEHHWVTHRFSLPDGQLSTYDTYPERSLPDGRPLGWWFAIRSAWPHASYPPADALVQKMVRINRPMQLLVDCSVAAAAIWRNLLMGSKAERSVDLERLRDLVSTEVKSLKQRKEMGRLTVSNSKWEE